MTKGCIPPLCHEEALPLCRRYTVAALTQHITVQQPGKVADGLCFGLHWVTARVPLQPSVWKHTGVMGWVVFGAAVHLWQKDPGRIFHDPKIWPLISYVDTPHHFTLWLVYPSTHLCLWHKKKKMHFCYAKLHFDHNDCQNSSCHWPLFLACSLKYLWLLFLCP